VNPARNGAKDCVDPPKVQTLLIVDMELRVQSNPVLRPLAGMV
jgi:hypothetical protein